MGCATADFLKRADDKLDVAVVEMDPTYSRASTTLSMANARIQFSLKENIQISQFTFEVLERFEQEMAVEDNRPNVAFRREGNLFLANDAGKGLADLSSLYSFQIGTSVDYAKDQGLLK